MKFTRSASLWLFALVVVAASCAQEELPQGVWDGRNARTSADGGGNGSGDAGGPIPDATIPGTRPGTGSDGAPSSAPGQCMVARALPMPARLAVMSGSRAATTTVTTPAMGSLQAIVNGIQTSCNYSGCHPGGGGFAVTVPSDLLLANAGSAAEGFPNQGEWALYHIEGEDATQVANGCPPSCQAMPPLNNTTPSPGIPWSTRKHGNDAVVQLHALLSDWYAANEPNGPFPLTLGAGADASAPAVDTRGDGGSTSSYAMTPEVGNAMSSLGSCVPDPAFIGTERDKMVALDAMFAGLNKDPSSKDPSKVIGLPALLSLTDVTTFDGVELARAGVIAFVPQYPLWTDDTEASRTGKIRFVRVPVGQHIHFDKTTQEFTIPENTRFYKTFLKQIIDTDGNPSWRKMETRLIVSRADGVNADDGKALQNALYGSYMWNDDETEARLVGTFSPSRPMNDGSGFEDQFYFTSAYDPGTTDFKQGGYETDVNLAASVSATFDPSIGSTLEQTLVGAHALRHYAIPSSQRCIDCHMGSPSQSFVLGFRPVQLEHRPVGVGGIIEPSGDDEMTQVRRLIDYGVVDGIASPSDILPLEESEGDRKPRNAYELTAQGYMLGNCSHCHNPRGRPSVDFTVLAKTLIFLPRAEDGWGIFQFPLEKFSPRIQRGAGGVVPIPYITPSLVDNPSVPPDLLSSVPQGTPWNQGYTTPGMAAWRPKWETGTPAFVYAPWRGLVYRNVDTPFTYTDDLAIYPHMPINSPGYDCRARQILGDWMVSIPAVRKRPDIDEYVNPYLTSDGLPPSAPPYVSLGDDSPQPYVEVLPGSPGYAAAQAVAQDRLTVFHTGTRPGETIPPGSTGIPRYAACPETWDIVDPAVNACQPSPTESVSFDNPAINVPTHAHWVPLDLTVSSNNSTGDAGASGWQPRGANWKEELVPNDAGCPQTGWIATPIHTCLSTTAGTGCAADSIGPAQLNQTALVAGLLQSVTLDPAARAFLTTPVPIALWKDNPACDWSKDPWKSAGPTLSEERATHPRLWMNTPPPGSSDNSRVYSESYGAAVFNMICINCHGTKFDSHGRLADNLATITGGHTRVADLRDGLFGPGRSPGANRKNVFFDVASALVDAGQETVSDNAVDDWAARYMAYMALGGTHAVIPEAFLSIVSNAPVFGERRGSRTTIGTPNMLAEVRVLCKSMMLGTPSSSSPPAVPGLNFFQFHESRAADLALLWDTGDAEMWLKLCSFNNPPPVQPYHYSSAHGTPAGIYPELGNAFRREGIERSTADPACNPSAGQSRPNWCAGVGDEYGNVGPLASPAMDAGAGRAGLPANLHPWCIRQTTEPSFLPWLQAHCVGGANCAGGACNGPDCVHHPMCPPEDARSYSVLDVIDESDPGKSETETWALRGAVNGGLAVFMYLDDVTNGRASPFPPNDHCEQLLSSPVGDAGAP